MRTTVDLERGLLERAKKALGATTYREAITRALNEAVERADLRKLLDRLEASNLIWSLDEALAYRRTERGDAP